MCLTDQLISAIRKGDNPLVIKLLDKMTIDQVNHSKFSSQPLSCLPLHMAAVTNNATALSLLLMLPGIQVNVKDNCGRTPIMVAAMEKSRAAVEMLLKDERVDLSIRCGGHDLEDMIDPNSDLKNLVEVVKEALNNRIAAKRDSIPKIMEREIQRELSNDLSELLASGAFSDFKIVCGTETFACHKNVLATRSTYMEAMLNSGMKEVDEGVMEIKDLEVEEVRAVLNFIYTGRVKNIRKNSSILLRAADRYELLGLKKLCEKELISSMKSDNVLDRLILADSAQAINLRDSAKKWILKHSAEVLQQKEWREKIATCGGVIYELFEAMSSERTAKRKRARENRDAQRQRRRQQHFEHEHHHEHDHDEDNHHHEYDHDEDNHHHEQFHDHNEEQEHEHIEEDEDDQDNAQQEGDQVSDSEPDDELIDELMQEHHDHQFGNDHYDQE